MKDEAVNAAAERKTSGRCQNPYLKPLVSRLIALPFFMAAYVLWFNHTAYAGVAYIMIAMLTLSMVPKLSGFFQYRKFKKRHPEPEFDRHYFEKERDVDSFPYRSPRR